MKQTSEFRPSLYHIVLGWNFLLALFLYGAKFPPDCATTGLVALVVLLIAKTHRQRSSSMPSAPWIPLLGSLPFLTAFPEKKMRQWGEAYGDIFVVRFANKKMVILNSMEAIHEAFVKNKRCTNGRYRSEVLEETTKGDGIIFLDAESKWEEQRKFWHHAMRNINGGGRRIEKYINESCRQFVDEISGLAGYESTKTIYGNDKNNLNEPANYFTSLIRSERWEIPVNKAQSESKSINLYNPIHRNVSRFLNTLVFGDAFEENSQNLYDLAIESSIEARKSGTAFLLAFLMPIIRKIPPISRVIEEALDFRHRYGETYQRIIDRKSKSTTPKDFVGEFTKQIHKTKDNSSSFNREQLLGFVIDLGCAGFETVTAASLWSVLYLAENQEIQTRLRDEIIQVIGPNKNPSYRDIMAIPYLQATVHEVLRVRPISPLGLPHKVIKSFKMADYVFEKNISIMPNIWAVHHNPKVFPNPEEFKPSRFIGDDGNFVSSPHVIPFSVGGRECLGKKITKIFITQMIASLCVNYTFENARIWDEKTKSYKPSDGGVIDGVNKTLLYAPDYEVDISICTFT